MEEHSPHDLGDGRFEDDQDDDAARGYTASGHDDLAALDFSAPADDHGSDLAAVDFATYGGHETPPPPTHPVEPVDPVEDGVPVPLYTVANPPGTVTVTSFLDGRVSRIELHPRAARMSEAQLAEEIVVIARLATQDARSAQYAFMLEGMRQQGHDDADTRDFLSRDLDLPSPERADAERAALFATRYVGDHD